MSDCGQKHPLVTYNLLQTNLYVQIHSNHHRYVNSRGGGEDDSTTTNTAGATTAVPRLCPVALSNNMIIHLFAIASYSILSSSAFAPAKVVTTSCCLYHHRQHGSFAFGRYTSSSLDTLLNAEPESSHQSSPMYTIPISALAASILAVSTFFSDTNIANAISPPTSFDTSIIETKLEVTPLGG